MVMKYVSFNETKTIIFKNKKQGNVDNLHNMYDFESSKSLYLIKNEN